MSETVERLEQRIPRVSIGLPVYNGEPYLRETLDSLLAQTFTAFELMISDNASTDQTEKLCREYAAKDQRIRYLRNETNRGAAANYNRTFELSRGEYFKWAPADDVCAPEFLARCVDALDRDPAAVLAATDVIDIDEAGSHLRMKTPPAEVASTEASVRFRRLIRWNYSCEMVLGLIRSDILRRTDLIGKYAGADHILLSQLALFGRFILIPEALFFRRMHAKRSTKSYPIHSRIVWYDPSAKGKIVFPFWRLFSELWDVIHTSRLQWQDRLRCYATIGLWVLWERRSLVRDLLYYPNQWLKWYVPGAKPKWGWHAPLGTRTGSKEEGRSESPARSPSQTSFRLK